MTGESTLAISVSVVSLTQLLKWSGIKDIYGPILVLLLSLFGVIFWGWTQGDITRSTAFGYFAGWIVVATSAAGVYGFTRAGAEAVTRMSPPPGGGAGSEATIKTTEPPTRPQPKTPEPSKPPMKTPERQNVKPKG